MGQHLGLFLPFEIWVVVSSKVSVLDQLFGISQFESQSLAPLLQVRAQPPLLLIALWIYFKYQPSVLTDCKLCK